MRKMLLTLAAAFAGFAAQAQTVATFESLTLSKPDTSYINFDEPGKNVGFDNGLASFPCVYDTSGGYSYWSYGFSYSNWTDSVTSGFMNQYSAKTAQGFAASEKYAVAYGTVNTLPLKGAAIGQSVMGFYITNSTFAYNSMRDGDGFARKFTGAAKDWFRLDVFAYRGSSIISDDSVSFYLADFRHTDTTFNYIINDWQWVDLISLGHADSLYFRLSSSDNSGPYMNTPAYFCMDNFTTNETGLSAGTLPAAASIKVYPNPATAVLVVDPGTQQLQRAIVTDLSGRIISSHEVNGSLEINTSALVPGTYMLVLSNGKQQTAVRFQKQ